MGLSDKTAVQNPVLASANALQGLTEILRKVSNNLGKTPDDERTVEMRAHVEAAISVVNPELTPGEILAEFEDMIGFQDEPSTDEELSVGHGIPGYDAEGKILPPFKPMALPSGMGLEGKAERN